MAFGHVFGFVGILVALPASAVLLVALRRARQWYEHSALYQTGDISNKKTIPSPDHQAADAITIDKIKAPEN
jgi:hypothetical protein